MESKLTLNKGVMAMIRPLRAMTIQFWIRRDESIGAVKIGRTKITVFWGHQSPVKLAGHSQPNNSLKSDFQGLARHAK